MELTVRELWTMSKGRQAAWWDIASSIIAVLCNIHRDPKKSRRPCEPADFHPFRTKADTTDAEQVRERRLQARLAMLPDDYRNRVMKQWQNG